jgi:signal peptidase II
MLMQKCANFKWLGLSLSIILLDQVAKHWIIQHLTPFRPYKIVPLFKSFFQFLLIYNPGSAFSFLSRASGWQRWFLVWIAAIIVIILCITLYRLPSHKKWLAFSISCILGGAIGNLIDRIQVGYVIDFMDLFFKTWHWPIFNVADTAISLGIVLLVGSSLEFGIKKS